MSIPVPKDCMNKAVTTLARAFVGYPYPGGAVKGDDRQEKCLLSMFDLELERVSRFGELRTDTSGCNGVAVWCRMGDLNAGVSLSKQMRALITTMTLPEIIKTLRRCISVERGRDKMNLADDVEYLYILGVNPECQGKGIGSALVREKIAQCDREHRRMYLESNSEHNVGFYQSFGFVLVKTIVEERGKFTTWYMIREPQEP